MQKLYEVYHNFYAEDFMSHPLFTILIFLILLDIALGFGRAWAKNQFNSSKARSGLVSHFGLITSLTILYPWLIKFELALPMDAVLVFFVLTYLSSILANWVVLGGKVPGWVLNKLNTELTKYEADSAPETNE